MSENSEQYFFNFSFFKVDPKWRWMADLAKEESAKDQKALGFMTGNNPKKHVIVYPFTKTREWYLLPKEKRQEIMDEHIEVSKKYPQIVLNTTYSFGIHDEDFMLAFEVDEIRDFQDLIMDLRETQVSTYVKNDIPMIVCVKKDIIPLITSLG